MSPEMLFKIIEDARQPGLDDPLQAATLHGCGIAGLQANVGRFGSSPSKTEDYTFALKESQPNSVERDQRAEGFIKPIEDIAES